MKSSSAGSRLRLCCPAPKPPPCCSGRCSPQDRSPCARSTDGRPSPRNQTIRSLTSPHDRIASCRPKMRQSIPTQVATGSGDGTGCTTPHQKTHGTEAGDEVEVVYPWHPWVGRTVCVHEGVERGAIASARCSLAGATPVRIRELPLWMLDAAGCRTMRVEAHPMATLWALAALHALLSAERKRSDAEPEAAAISSPESRGDRHGTSSSDLNPPGQLELGLANIPISPSSPPHWTALPEPTQRTLTELLTRLLVSHAGSSLRRRPGATPMSVEKIGPQHRVRKAVLYVRQSSVHQVQHDRESQRLQYAMRDRLLQLGWLLVSCFIIGGTPHSAAVRKCRGLAKRVCLPRGASY